MLKPTQSDARSNLLKLDPEEPLIDFTQTPPSGSQIKVPRVILLPPQVLKCCIKLPFFKTLKVRYLRGLVVLILTTTKMFFKRGELTFKT